MTTKKTSSKKAVGKKAVTTNDEVRKEEPTEGAILSPDGQPQMTLRSVLIEYSQTQVELAEHQKAEADIRVGRSQHLLMIARTFRTAEAFDAMCKVDEEWIKSPEAGVNRVDKIDRAWINAKSNIKASFKFKMDLNAKNDKGDYIYDTESKLRKDLTAKRKAESAESGESEVTISGADLGKGINQALKALIKEAHRATTPEMERSVVSRIVGVTNDLKVLFDELVGGTVERVEDTETDEGDEGQPETQQAQAATG